MYIEHGIFYKVPIVWGESETTRAAGTPMSSAGAIANTSSALGILPETVTPETNPSVVYLLVGGDVNLDEVETLSGLTIASAAKSAAKGIRFWKNGTF